MPLHSTARGSVKPPEKYRLSIRCNATIKHSKTYKHICKVIILRKQVNNSESLRNYGAISLNPKYEKKASVYLR